MASRGGSNRCNDRVRLVRLHRSHSLRAYHRRATGCSAARRIHLWHVRCLLDHPCSGMANCAVVQHFGDGSEQYGTTHPFFDAVSATLLLAGLAYACIRIRQIPFFFCLTSFASILVVGGVLTIDPPFWPRASSFSRSLRCLWRCLSKPCSQFSRFAHGPNMRV